MPTLVKASYRDALGHAFLKMGEEIPELMIVTADVSKSTRSVWFKEKYPERFLSVGIAEANAVGISAGIATFGIPVIFTAYSVFATEKPFEQIRNMIAYPNLNVTIAATHGGINVGQDGVTHQAVEDIALMRAVPNMKVLVVADPGETEAALRAAVNHPGPVWMRIPRADDALLHQRPPEDYRIGKAEVLREGGDVTIVAIGMMVTRALEAAERLAERGVEATVINARSLKPLDEHTLLDFAGMTGALVTAEDHTCFGGLYGAVAELTAAARPVPVERVALENTFGESGDGYELMNKYGLTTENIAEKALRAVARKG